MNAFVSVLLLSILLLLLDGRVFDFIQNVNSYSVSESRAPSTCTMLRTIHSLYMSKRRIRTLQTLDTVLLLLL